MTAGYEHPVDTVVNDLVDCLEDLALPLMQFTEAFAVVQVSPPVLLCTRGAVALHALCVVVLHAVALNRMWNNGIVACKEAQQGSAVRCKCSTLCACLHSLELQYRCYQSTNFPSSNSPWVMLYAAKGTHVCQSCACSCSCLEKGNKEACVLSMGAILPHLLCNSVPSCL